MSSRHARESAEWASEAGKLLLTFAVAPLLPREERRLWPWREWSKNGTLLVLSAAFHTVVALGLYVAGLVSYVKRFGELYTAALVDPNAPESATLSSHYGVIGFLSWVVSPLGLLAGLYITDSVVRAFGSVSGNAPGSFFLWLPCLALRKLRRSWEEAALTARYGPADLPLRIEKRGNTLFVRASRSRDDWHELLTYSYGDELFKLVWRGEAPAGGGKFYFEYRMEPWTEATPVRRILLLDPP